MLRVIGKSWIDHLFHCRDVVGYACTNAEHCRWVERSDGPIWCYDQVQSGTPQWCLECITVDHGNLTHFSLFCNQARSTLYSDNCLSSEHLFGCISLRRKKYCVLNQEYTREEYERVASQIIERMRSAGEWGEFFPIAYSPFGYNETNAQEFYPLGRDEVLGRGWTWQDQLPFTTGKETLTSKAVPDRIDDVPDSLCQEILACARCRRNYRLVAQELKFYKVMDIPVPTKCPDCRNIERLARRNPQKLWTRPCGKCSKEMQTSYAPERPEIVYCEECYLKEVY